MLNVALRLVEGAEVDKEKALEAAISQIERSCGKGSIMRLGQNEKAVEVEAISTGSLGLDIALGIGGLPRGRVIEIYGPESSGKTTLALHVVAEAQKKGGICGFIDAEHALDTVYARKLGMPDVEGHDEGRHRPDLEVYGAGRVRGHFHLDDLAGLGPGPHEAAGEAAADGT